MPDVTLHRPPTQPHRGWLWFLASQVLVAWVWWRLGWQVGLPAMLLTHMLFMWGVLWPYSRLHGPVLNRLPGDAPRVWLTIPEDKGYVECGYCDRRYVHISFAETVK